MLNRESLYEAFYQTLRGLDGFETVTRFWQDYTKIPKEKQPWLCLSDGLGDKPDMKALGLPANWSLACELTLYCQVPQGKTRGPIINPLLDQITNLFDGTPTGRQTLGGVAYWVKLTGEIRPYGGIIEEQVIVPIPVIIVTGGIVETGKIP